MRKRIATAFMTAMIVAAMPMSVLADKNGDYRISGMACRD